MKKYVIILSILLLSTVTGTVVKAQQEDPFEQLYKQATDNVYKYLYKDKYGPVTPQWRGSDTFCYQTTGQDSTEYYKVDLKTLTKTQVCRDTLDAFRAPERQRGAWGGFGGVDVDDAGVGIDGHYPILMVAVRELCGAAGAGIGEWIGCRCDGNGLIGDETRTGASERYAYGFIRTGLDCSSTILSECVD